MNDKMKMEMIEWINENKIKSQFILCKLGSFRKKYGYSIKDIRENQAVYDWVVNYVRANEQIKKDFK